MTDRRKLRETSQQKSLYVYVFNRNDSQFGTYRLGDRDIHTGKDVVVNQNDGQEVSGKRIFNSSIPIGSPLRATSAYGNAILALDHRSRIEPDDPIPPTELPQGYVFKCLFAVVLPSLNQTQIWLGVDRVSPTLIYTYPYVLSASDPIGIGLTHLGIKRNSWVVSFYRKTGTHANPKYEIIYYKKLGAFRTWELKAKKPRFKGWNVWDNELVSVTPTYHITTPLPGSPPSTGTYIRKGVQTSDIRFDGASIGTQNLTIDNARVQFEDNPNLIGLLCDFDRTTVAKIVLNENKSEITDETYEYKNKSLWCSDRDLIENDITTKQTKYETYTNKFTQLTEITYKWMCHFSIEGYGIGGVALLIGRYLGSMWNGEFSRIATKENRISEITKTESGNVNITKNLHKSHENINYESYNTTSDIRSDKFYNSFGHVNKIIDYLEVEYTNIKSTKKDTASIVLRGETHTIFKTELLEKSTKTHQYRLRDRTTLRDPETDVFKMDETTVTEDITTSHNKYYVVNNEPLATIGSSTDAQYEQIEIDFSPSINASIQGALNYSSSNIGKLVALPSGTYHTMLAGDITKKTETRVRTINVDILDNNPNINKTDVDNVIHSIPKDVSELFLERECCAVGFVNSGSKPILRQYYGIIKSYQTVATNTLTSAGTVHLGQNTTTTSYIPGYVQEVTITSVTMQLTRIEDTSYDLRKPLNSPATHFQFYTLGSIQDLPVNMTGDSVNHIPMVCTLVKPETQGILARLLVSESTVKVSGKLVSYAESYDLVRSNSTSKARFIRRAYTGKESLKTNQNYRDIEKLLVGKKLATGKEILVELEKLILCNPKE